MSKLVDLTISQAKEKLIKKEISSVELTKAYLSEIENANQALNAYVKVTAETAIEMAEAADERIKQGSDNILEGIPLGVKDNFATKNVHTQCCSKILEGFKPPYESTVTQNLWASGAVMLGKLNMDEFAMGSSNETSVYGPVVNPWKASDSDKELVAGGSSGGSAAAVAAKLCMGATASDTGGSIRQPAGFTSTVGIKPTYGRCSRWGMLAFSSSLDQAGCITRTVEDCAIMLRSISSYDLKDSTSVNIEVPNYQSYLGQSIKGKKIAIPDFSEYDLSEEVIKFWQIAMNYLRDAGAELVDIKLPYSKYGLAVYYIIASAEASSNLARYDGARYGLREAADNIIEMYEKTRAKGFGPEVQRRILTGCFVLSEEYYQKYYINAQKLRRLIKQDYDNAFAAGADAILMPCAPFTPFEIGAKNKDENFVAMYLNDLFNVGVNMAGLPAIGLPIGLSENKLPIGLQLIGKAFDEATLLQLASIIEKNTGIFEPTKWW